MVATLTIGHRLRFSRELHNWSQLGIAVVLGMSQQRLSNYENNHTDELTYEFVTSFSRECYVHPDWLMTLPVCEGSHYLEFIRDMIISGMTPSKISTKFLPKFLTAIVHEQVVPSNAFCTAFIEALQ